MGGKKKKIFAEEEVMQPATSCTCSCSPACSPEPVYINERLPPPPPKVHHQTCLASSSESSPVDGEGEGEGGGGGGFAINGALSMASAAAAESLSNLRYEEVPTLAELEEGLELGMSLNSGEEPRDSAPEGIVAVKKKKNPQQQQQQTCFGMMTEPLVKSQMVQRDCKIQAEQVTGCNTQQQQQKQQQQESMRICDSHAHGLPSCLVVSPPSCHDGKHMVLDHYGKQQQQQQVVLDPNAREYTPAQAPLQLPPGVLHMAVPTAYHIDQAHVFTPGIDVGQLAPSQMMNYGSAAAAAVADYGMAGPLVPLLCNGGAVGFAPVLTGAQSTASWELLGMPDVVQHRGSAGSSGILAPAQTAIGIGQAVQMSHPVVQQPYAGAAAAATAIIQPFISMPGCPTMTLPGNNNGLMAQLHQPSISGHEHVSRALLLNGVPGDMDEHRLKQEMELWGPVRAMGMERINQGLVIVHYYDLRHTKEALSDIQQQHLWHQQRMQRRLQRRQQHHSVAESSSSSVQPSHESRHESVKNSSHDESGHDRPETAATHADDHRGSDDLWADVGATTTRGLIAGKVMWAQYTLASGATAAAGPDALNQGTLVVFNLNTEMSLDTLWATFEKYGTVKELRETPAKKMHKFVEFYDIRDAAKALKALDNQEIGGKRVKIEFSRPGGQAYKARAQAQQQTLVPNQHKAAPSFAGASNQPSILGTAACGALPGGPLYMSWNADCTGALSRAAAAGPPSSYLWTGYGSIPSGTPLPPIGFVHGQQWNSVAAAAQMQSLPYRAAFPTIPQSQGAGVSALMGLEHSLPFGQGGTSATGMMGYGGLSSSSGAGDDSVGTTPASEFRTESNNSLACRTRGDGGGIPGRRKRNLALTHASDSSGFAKCERNTVQQGSGGKTTGSSRDGSSGAGSSGLTSTKCLGFHESSVPLQYMFEEGELPPDESPRTTLMIRNIPNKYSQAMLLQLLDQHCVHSNTHLADTNEPESAYDFVYLPIDFKNRCNLGYAFVNFTTVEATKRLYKAFHAQQWEAFNSRKICQVTYARVQGRAALEEHFRNSRFACDNDKYLPLRFLPPRTGSTQTPPMVAAGHLVTQNGDISTREKRGVDDIDNNTKRVTANGNNNYNNCSWDQEASAAVHGRVRGGNRSNGPPQQQQQQQHR